MLRGINLIFLLVCLLPLQSVFAQINSLNQTSSQTTAPLNTTGTSQITWTVNATIANPTTASVTSSVGEFRAPDQSLLGTSRQVLTQSTVTTVPFQNLNFSLGEFLAIPQSVVRLATQKGFNQIYYIRDFTDTPDASVAQGSLIFNIVSSSSGSNLSIDRIELQFDNQKVQTIARLNQALRVEAMIKYSGSGVMDYSWEVAGPPSTSGQFIYTPILYQQQFLAAGGKLVLSSPALNTGQQGEYRVRLVVRSPESLFKIPELTYAVISSVASNGDGVANLLQLVQPSENANLLPDTLFSWEAVGNAVAYQLEIYNDVPQSFGLPGQAKQSPVTGVLLPVEKTSVSLSEVSMKHLMTNRRYFWRVIAISKSGKSISMSSFRKIIYP